MLSYGRMQHGLKILWIYFCIKLHTHIQKNKLKAQRTKTIFFTHITPYRLSGTQEDPVAIEAKR